jgi:flavin reductase (DIM6/NTAB) family NADH-FMN oxidoreductase RutF
MMAVAIQNVARSYELIQQAGEFVLAVPGESLAQEAMFCGVNSLSEVDKVEHLKLDLRPSEKVAVPSLGRAIANVEMVREAAFRTGDHVLVVGKVVRFAVNRRSRELPLLSVGPDTQGFRVLLEKGIHRIGVVESKD